MATSGLHYICFHRLCLSGLFGALFIMCFLGKGQAQQKDSLNPTILVYDSLGKAVRFFYVKVEKLQPRQIILYKNAGDTNAISIAMPDHKGDSVICTVMAQGFAPFVVQTTLSDIKLWQPKHITLQYVDKTLPNAVVQAPPRWVRGDTTFFRAEAYRQPGENKLKDIITRMPGFEITRDGTLLFKKMPVQKMTINGEDIFSDKLEMLMNSFPLHVLENVQALENQQSNPALKGLSNERLVYVNLELKKQGVKAAFGDGEAGIGTQNRYLFNPVLFALYRKLKGGFIGNYNSLGTGFDYKYERELKKEPEMQAEDWMMRAGLMVINNVESRRYVRNGLADNRLQVNIPLAKNNQLQNEFAFITDRQRLQSLFDASILSGDSIIKRFDTSLFSTTPLFIRYSGKTSMQPSTGRFLRLNYFFNGNLSAMNRNSSFGFVNAPREITLENFENNLWGGWAQAEYTTRHSELKATNLLANISFQKFRQNARAAGTNLGSYYGGEEEYNTLLHAPTVEQLLALIRNEWLTKGKSKLWQYGLQAEYKQHEYDNEGFLFAPLTTGDKLALDLLSTIHNQYTFKAGGYAKQAFDIKKMRLSADVAGGGLHTQIEGHHNENINYSMPWYQVVADARWRLNRLSNFILKLDHQNDMRPASQWVNGFRPADVQQFNQFFQGNIPQTISTVTTSYGGGFKHFSFGLYATYARTWNAGSSFQLLEKYVQATLDSATRMSTDAYSFNLNTSYHNVPNNLIFQLNAFWFASQRLYTINAETGKGLMSNSGLSLRVTKDWLKKLQMELNGRFTFIRVTLPGFFSSNFIEGTGELLVSGKIQYQIFKNVRLKVSGDQYFNNLYTVNKAAFFFGDAECSYGKEKSKYSFRLRLENITNTARFSRVMNSPTSQSFYSIPFVPRNIAFFVRYQF